MSEYEKQAADFLAGLGVTFTAVLIGSDCPRFCEDHDKGRDLDKVNTYPRRTHIHGKHYLCTFTAKDGKSFSIDFWNSYADEEYNALGTKKYQRGESSRKYDQKKIVRDGREVMVPDANRKPTPYDVLACIQKRDPGTFHDFCADFGYDEDSRKAEAIYHAVQEEWTKVQRFFPAESFEALEAIA